MVSKKKLQTFCVWAESFPKMNENLNTMGQYICKIKTSNIFPYACGLLVVFFSTECNILFFSFNSLVLQRALFFSQVICSATSFSSARFILISVFSKVGSKISVDQILHTWEYGYVY